jgi:DNA invertase Pin-like site-specific DNA recombinase
MRVLTVTATTLQTAAIRRGKMMRQIAGSFHEYEKARLVAELKAARDRKRAIGTKVEGRKSHAELNPEMVALARQLAAQGRPAVITRDIRRAGGCRISQ